MKTDLDADGVKELDIRSPTKTQQEYAAGEIPDEANSTRRVSTSTRSAFKLLTAGRGLLRAARRRETLRPPDGA